MSTVAFVVLSKSRERENQPQNNKKKLAAEKETKISSIRVQTLALGITTPRQIAFNDEDVGGGSCGGGGRGGARDQGER